MVNLNLKFMQPKQRPVETPRLNYHSSLGFPIAGCQFNTCNAGICSDLVTFT